ncbi:MAG TPA: FliM/FliN family flagellar motor switch protein [Phycisphaerae bacterium]|nr:FliM/FliN family flagellar motor switch protein [Phycisphaerae bacterium]
MTQATVTDSQVDQAQAENAADGAAGQATEPSPPTSEGQSQDQVEAQPAQFAEAAATAVLSAGGQIDLLLNSTLPVSASLGDVVMNVGELLRLGQGSVIRLDRRVGEPVDLILRGVKFASGHLVVVGDQLGIRVKEIYPSARQSGADV